MDFSTVVKDEHLVAAKEEPRAGGSSIQLHSEKEGGGHKETDL